VTTPDPTTGRLAATRRPRAAALVCACLFAAPVLPAFAMQPTALSTAAPASAAAGTRVAVPVAVPVAGVPAKDPGDTVALQDQPLQMSDRALLLAGDINRLMGRTAAPGHAVDADTGTTTGGRIQRVLQRALTLLGTPYRWGGTTTDGFDCSGLVGYVFRTTLGIELPRVSRDMARTGEEVDRGSLVPGDLVFFGRKGRVDHVGIYLGDNRFVHAPRTGRDVTVSNLDGYWGRKFLEARRVAGI
jgi:cell wall-associated NlpC family hydrolase